MCKALLVLLLTLARGEGPNSCSVTGYVSDEYRVSIPGATVSIRSAFSSDVQSTKTDENGMYRLTRLHQGRYSAFATAARVFLSIGFQCFTASSGGDAFGFRAVQIKKRTGIGRFAE